jgi:hypothetical protein
MEPSNSYGLSLRSGGAPTKKGLTTERTEVTEKRRKALFAVISVISVVNLFFLPREENGD